MALVLYSFPMNKNAFKALIAAEYNGVKIEYAKDFQMRATNTTPEFLKKNPMGKVPLLDTPEGPIFESNAIARYVCRQNECTLLGASLYEQALVDQWIDFATTEIDPYLGVWCRPIMGYAVFNPQLHELAITSLKRSLTALNLSLASRTYLVGDSVTLADIIMTCNLYIGFKLCMTKEFTSEFPHVERYLWTLVNQPEFCKHFGEFKQVDKVADPATKAPEKPAEKTRELPAVPVKENTEKKAPKAKEPEKELNEIEEEDAKPKSKPKNPLDLLPPSPMIMDEWKRLYSNTKAHNFREVAIKGFWDMFDAEGYSLWFCDYKYNEENMVTFVTMNKVSGFLQRMDFIRKYGFAKICILGESAPFKIKGVWLFRGSEVPQIVLDECYDVELYEWTKVDLSDEAQKERVNAYFEEPDEIDGEKLLEAKCFK